MAEFSFSRRRHVRPAEVSELTAELLSTLPFQLDVAYSQGTDEVVISIPEQALLDAFSALDSNGALKETK